MVDEPAEVSAAASVEIVAPVEPEGHGADVLPLPHPGKSHLRAGEPALKLDGRRVTKRYYLRTAAPVEIEAEALGQAGAGTAYITAPLSAADMHALAARLRGIDGTTFFAALR